MRVEEYEESYKSVPTAVREKAFTHITRVYSSDQFTYNDDNCRAQITHVVNRIRDLLDDNNISDDMIEKICAQLKRELEDYTFKYDLITPLLEDETVTEIMVQDGGTVFAEVGGRIKQLSMKIDDQERLENLIDKIADDAGRRCDYAVPLCDCVISAPGTSYDQSRVNATKPPVSIDGCTLTIRKSTGSSRSLNDLMDLGSISPEGVRLLESSVLSRMNIVVSGGTGSGKTTLLNALSNCIGDWERVVTIEDTAELKLKCKNLVRMQSRPAGIGSESNEITIRDLVKNALRQRPDRIVVGECRSSETIDMLQAMSTGHDGSLTTVHANSSADTCNRIVTMVRMGDSGVSEELAERLISSAVDMIVFTARLENGKRRVTDISLVIQSGNSYSLDPILSYDKENDRWYCKNSSVSKDNVNKFKPECREEVYLALRSLAEGGA